MIIKAVFGNSGHIRIIHCYDIHLERKKDYTEMIINYNDNINKVIHLGKKSDDHLYIMDEGQTVDHMVFYQEKIKEK